MTAARVARGSGSPAPLGLVVLFDLSSRPCSLDEIIQAAYGLTPAEADLAAALACGESLVAYAERRQRSQNTVRTHPRSVFAKTGTGRQSELVRTLSALSLL